MNQLNNKGQVLVLFVILLPVLLLIIIGLIEISSINLEKTKTKNIIKETIETNLKNYNENTKETVNKLIEQNIKNIKTKTIFISEDEIRINIIQEKTIFGKNIELKYNYKGIKENEKITISEG